MLLRIASDEDEPFEDALDQIVLQALRKAEASRYLFRSRTYRSGRSYLLFEEDLQDPSQRADGSEWETEEPWLNDEEWLQKYRMSRQAFGILLDKIKDHAVFHPPKARKEQAPMAHQLMTWLKYVGTEGSGASNSNQRNTFRISRGTAEAHRRRVTKPSDHLMNNTFIGLMEVKGR